MIKYDRFWETLKCGIDKKLLHRLRKNENVEIFSLDRICRVLNCDLEDIVEYVPDKPAENTNTKRARKEAAATITEHLSVM